MTATHQDLFAEARERFTISDAWTLLGLEGEPKSSCKSPFREDRSPSFSIHSDGTAWTDHATGEGGDVIEFIRHAIGGDHRAVRHWLQERIGTDHHAVTKAPRTPAKVSKPPKAIKWPSDPHTGTMDDWSAFAQSRGLTFPAVHVMVQAGILRFCRADGRACYVVTDATSRAAEIRRLDGEWFGDNKAFWLSGVDKSWLPGAELLAGEPKDVSAIITEGATDLLSAIDLYSRYKRNHDGKSSWVPMALLGAKCRNLHPEASDLLKGRHVRIVPDGDEAGDEMADHWTGLLRRIGCAVDVVTLPRGTDLTDNLATISPPDLFSK
jgi:hypothetical protein